MELGDRFLVVQRAALGANPMKADGTPGGSSTPSLVSGTDSQPTRVLQILNMVSVDELVIDEDHKEITEDITEECTKYGKVEEVKIPRPVPTVNGKVDIKASEAVKDLGKVFVLFEKPEEATAALRAIAGRQFGGSSYPFFL